MSGKRRTPTLWGAHALLLLAYSALFLNAECSAVATVHESDGELVEAPVQDQVQTQGDTDTAIGLVHPLASTVEPSQGAVSVAGDTYLLQNREQPQIERKEAPRVSSSGMLGRMVTTSLLASIVILMGLVFWEVYNFVGDVPDPFKDVTDPKLIPAMIEEMLAKGKSFAFVVRRCKYCGMGIRALKRGGKDTVVVMVEGHPHQGVISRYLRSAYGARGFPFFIIDNDRYGYFSRIKQHLADESPR
ncbi:hypothetical protein, conserved [Eimeria brunetti]|uniref:Glutaredoxin domain-containing protein n=1 Tax=Eimeria brunetti TaxID=51314 RepID=U6LT26_9EIME|nr:hypothetical protein, conserved [Eimeria brunetti]